MLPKIQKPTTNQTSRFSDDEEVGNNENKKNEGPNQAPDVQTFANSAWRWCRFGEAYSKRMCELLGALTILGAITSAAVLTGMNELNDRERYGLGGLTIGLLSLSLTSMCTRACLFKKPEEEIPLLTFNDRQTPLAEMTVDKNAPRSAVQKESA